MKFIRLTRERTGDPVIFNADHIVRIDFGQNIGTVIHTSDGCNIAVQQSVEKIGDILKGIDR